MTGLERDAKATMRVHLTPVRASQEGSRKYHFMLKIERMKFMEIVLYKHKRILNAVLPLRKYFAIIYGLDEKDVSEMTGVLGNVRIVGQVTHCLVKFTPRYSYHSRQTVES